MFPKNDDLGAMLIYVTPDGSYTISVNDPDITGCEFVEQLVKPVMLAAGYHPKTVDEALGLSENFSV